MSLEGKINEHKNEIEKHENEIEELKKRLELLKGLTDKEQLATLLHDKMCRWNHTDGCDWYYGNITTDRRYSHDRYLEKAMNILMETPLEVALKVVNNI